MNSTPPRSPYRKASEPDEARPRRGVQRLLDSPSDEEAKAKAARAEAAKLLLEMEREGRREHRITLRAYGALIAVLMLIWTLVKFVLPRLL